MDVEKVFNAIKSFVTEINSLYGAHYKPLALYGRLVEKTDVKHEIPVKKHINAFKKFMVSNRNAIYSMSEQDFKPHKIQYNDNVYFNMKTIMNMADPDTQQIIWQHLLVLSALLDSESKAKQRIKENKSQSEFSGMDPMLSGIMNMVSSVMMDGGGSSGGDSGSKGSGTDISQMFGQIMSSGILPKMMTTISSSMKDGQIDIGNIVNSVQSLAKECNLDLPPIEGGEEEVDKVLDMFGGLGIDKNKMKDMVNVLQQHITVDEEDPETHAHTITSTDTTLVQVPKDSLEENFYCKGDLTSDECQSSDCQSDDCCKSNDFCKLDDVKDVVENTSVENTPTVECKDGVCYIK